MASLPKSVAAAFDQFDTAISLNPVERARAMLRHQEITSALVAAGMAVSTFYGEALHETRWVTHLGEFDSPERLVQDQVGHANASTTAIYTGVSDEYRNRLLLRSIQGLKMAIRWNLRRLMAERDLFQTSGLVPLLAERGIQLSREQVLRLVTQEPQRLWIDTLAALCDILDCSPNDLIEVQVVNEQTREAAGTRSSRPVAVKRSTIRRPEGL